MFVFVGLDGRVMGGGFLGFEIGYFYGDSAPLQNILKV